MNKLQEMSFLCKKHYQPVNYLHFRNNQDEFIKCSKCAIQEKINWSDLATLFEILNDPEENLAKLYVDDKQVELLKQFYEQSPQKNRSKIETFFSEFKKAVMIKIEEQEKAALRQAYEFEEKYNKTIGIFNEIWQRQELLMIFNNNKENNSNLNIELKNFFNRQQENKVKIENIIKEQFVKNEELFNIQDFSFNESLMIRILEYLDQIQFLNDKKYLQTQNSEKIEKILVNFLSNQTENLAQILTDADELLQKQEINIITFNEAQLGKFHQVIDQEVQIIQEQKQNNLQQLLHENSISKTILEQILQYPLTQKFKVISHIILTIPVISAIGKLNKSMKYQLIKSNRNQSQQAIIENNSEGNLSLKADNGKWFTVYLDFILNPNLKYLIQFKIINTSHTGYQFIGLIKEETKINDCAHLDYEAFSVYDSFYLTKKIKGNVTFQSKFKKENEFRILISIYLKDKLFRVSDFPEKSLIYDLQDKNINPEQQYRLGMDICYGNDMITIESLKTVENF